MYQQITILGHLGNDPEMRYTQSGTPVTSFSLATSKRWTGQDGQQQEKTTWFRISAWQKQAEVVAQYLKKGSKVMVVGEMEDARAYTDKNGNPGASLEVRAFTVRFLDSRGDNAGGGQPAAQPQQQAPQQQQAAPVQNNGAPPTVDDIPF